MTLKEALRISPQWYSILLEKKTFKENNVSIISRFSDTVWEIEEYNNTTFTPPKSSEEKLSITFTYGDNYMKTLLNNQDTECTLGFVADDKSCIELDCTFKESKRATKFGLHKVQEEAIDSLERNGTCIRE